VSGGERRKATRVGEDGLAGGYSYQIRSGFGARTDRGGRVVVLLGPAWDSWEIGIGVTARRRP
jgi:hypothetical protein